MEQIDKLNMRFTAGQVMKSELMNVIVNRIDEVVDAANLIPEVDEMAKANALAIEAIRNNIVWLTQDEFDEMYKAGTLDPTKEYRTYEEE